MSERDESGYLCHILDAIDRIRGYVAGMTEEAFLADAKTQDAVVRQLEIIGEASRHIGNVTKTRFQHVPWNKMVGMRNVLIHEYFGVDLHEVYRVAVDELGEVEAKVRPLLKLDEDT